MISLDFDVSDVLAKAEALDKDLTRGCTLAAIEASRAGALEAVKTAPRRTGELAESIKGRYLTHAGDTAEAVIEATAPHAEVVSKGSKPHDIVARGRALRFTAGGTTLFRQRVHHPGTAPNPFMESGERVAQSELGSSMEHYAEVAAAKFNAE